MARQLNCEALTISLLAGAMSCVAVPIALHFCFGLRTPEFFLMGTIFYSYGLVVRKYNTPRALRRFARILWAIGVIASAMIVLTALAGLREAIYANPGANGVSPMIVANAVYMCILVYAVFFHTALRLNLFLRRHDIPEGTLGSPTSPGPD